MVTEWLSDTLSPAAKVFCLPDALSLCVPIFLVLMDKYINGPCRVGLKHYELWLYKSGFLG